MMLIAIIFIILAKTPSFAQSLPTGCLFPDEIDLLSAYGPNDRVLPSLNKALCIINALQQEVSRKGGEVSACVTESILAAQRKCIKFNLPGLDPNSPARLSVISNNPSAYVIADGISSITQSSIDGCFFNTNPDLNLVVTVCASGTPE